MTYIVDEDDETRGKEWHKVGALRKQRRGFNGSTLNKALSTLDKKAYISNNLKSLMHYA